MLGHELTLHETNARGAVAVCGCGWYGVVHPAHHYKVPGAATIKTVRDGACDAARAEHARHLLNEREQIGAASMAELERYGKLIPLANETLQRRGRWGHP